jgi:hypothetical protein
MICIRTGLATALLLPALLMACGPKAPAPQEPVAPFPENAAPSPSPNVEAALAAEAKARDVSAGFAPLEEYADDIYEGPALMASYQGETVDGVYEGYGVLTLPDSGAIMSGLFARGLLNGPGTERGMQGELVHAGLYADGVPAEYLLPLSERPQQ